MKNKIQNIFIVSALLMANIALSQPDPDDAGDGVDPQDIGAPIDDMHFVILIMLAGIGFAFFVLQKKRASEIQ